MFIIACSFKKNRKAPTKAANNITNIIILHIFLLIISIEKRFIIHLNTQKFRLFDGLSSNRYIRLYLLTLTLRKELNLIFMPHSQIILLYEYPLNIQILSHKDILFLLKISILSFTVKSAILSESAGRHLS